MVENHIDGADLIAALPAVLDDIAARGAVYLVDLGPASQPSAVIRGLVGPEGRVVFALGPPENLGRVFGLIDEEYGWPHPVQVADVVTVGDVAPSYRRHPMLYRGGECVAMSVSWWEYERVGTGAAPDAEPRAAPDLGGM